MNYYLIIQKNIDIIILQKGVIVMFKRKNISISKTLQDVLTDGEKLEFLVGCVFYQEYTKEGRLPITKRKISSLKDDKIELLIRTMFNSNLDLMNDKVASKTLKRLGDEALKRDPRNDIDVNEKWQEFKRKNKEFFIEETEVEK